MHPWQKTPLRDAIAKYLREFGPATPEQISEDLEIDRTRIYSCISLTRKNTGTAVFRVAAWKRVPRHQLPLYEYAGDNPPQADAPKLRPVNKRTKQAKYRSTHRMQIEIRRRAKSGIVATPWHGLGT